VCGIGSCESGAAMSCADNLEVCNALCP
jgi:hypothetical protein